MSKLIGRTVAAVAIAALLMVAWRTYASAASAYDQAIKLLDMSLADGVRTKDIDKIMACYMNSEKLVVFDVIPPREYTGWDAYKANWQGFLNQCKDSPTWDESDLHILGGETWAFSHSIVHLVCTQQNGTKLDMVLRVTNGYARFKTKWLIAHQHISVPVDLATGKADLQSKP